MVFLKIQNQRTKPEDESLPKVLVATQVGETSLDIDAELFIYRNCTN